MNRQEIITRFREENPDITTNVISDTQAKSWCEVGDKEICARARLIKGESTISSVAGTRSYNLTSEITKFYDIDDFPGGGVVYNNDPLTLTTIAELDELQPNWRTLSNGTPQKYYRRNNLVYFEKAPDTSSLDILIYTVLVSDDFNDDDILPFNQYAHLEPFHYSMVLYLTMRAKAIIAKDKDVSAARKEYMDYIDWMKKEVNRGSIHTAQFRPQRGYTRSEYSANTRR